jgi:hypothetical protein
MQRKLGEHRTAHKVGTVAGILLLAPVAIVAGVVVGPLVACVMLHEGMRSRIAEAIAGDEYRRTYDEAWKRHVDGLNAKGGDRG